jgi:hypothetical protein
MVDNIEISQQINNVEVIEKNVNINLNVNVEPIINIVNVIKEEAVIQYNIEVNPLYLGVPGAPFTYDDFTPEQLAALKGKDQYQSYLDTTTDVPPLSEAEWSESFDLLQTIDALPEATTIAPTDKLMVLQGGELKRVESSLVQQKMIKKIQFNLNVSCNNTANYITANDSTGWLGNNEHLQSIGTNPLSFSGNVPVLFWCKENLTIKKFSGFFKSYLGSNFTLTIVKANLSLNKENYINPVIILDNYAIITAHGRHENFEITNFIANELIAGDLLFLFFRTPTPNGNNQRFWQSYGQIELEQI